MLRGILFDKCSAGDWTSTAVFFVVMVGVIFLAVKISFQEQDLKRKYGGIHLVPSDLIFEGRVLRVVLGLGFMGGWVAGALGLGGGVIFNPLLLALGVPPKVSSATGMYLITYSKIGACLIYILVGELDVAYGFWVAAWSSAGAMIGLGGANWFMSKFKRQSLIVVVLAIVMAISTVGVPIIGAFDLRNNVENVPGYDLMAFSSLCETKKK